MSKRSKPKPPPKKPQPPINHRRRDRDPLGPVIASARRAADARTRQLPTGDRDDDDWPPRHPDTHQALDRAAADAARGDGVAEKQLQELGPIVLPSPDDARRVLGELAALYHERFEAARAHDALKKALKLSAEHLAGLDTTIAERIRVATHHTGLPLFGPLEGADDGAHADA